MLDLVPFVEFKKCEKHLWRVILLVKLQALKVSLLHGCFSRFLNFTNGTKSYNASHIIHSQEKYERNQKLGKGKGCISLREISEGKIF